MNRFLCLLIGTMMVSAETAIADFELRHPVDCVLNETCFIQQFMDHDPSTGVRDFRCKGATYDGHKGTDFRVSMSQMNEGVNVVAAATGVVLGARNSMPDQRVVDEASREAVLGKECGNGVVLRHDGGWETQYCHLKQGSVTGQKGDRVEAGQILGQIGLSGRTQFAHLHLSVRKNGKPIDPFSINASPDGCKVENGEDIWDDDFWTKFRYQPTKIVQIGLADTGPSLSEVMDGDWDSHEASFDKPMVVFGLAVNGIAGDQLNLVLVGPNGIRIEDSRPALAKRKAQWFGFVGKKAPSKGWPRGEYNLTAQVIRNGQVLHENSKTIVLN